jgi:uncharacterized membrane protein YgdD (TMEM256/DUF423 family)
MDLRLLLAAAVFGGLGVAFGAFGAHALRRRVDAEMLAVFETGVRYQMYHAATLLGVAVLVVRMPGSMLPAIAGWLLVAGVLVFSGSLYLLALTGRRAIGAITPLGGLVLLAGWVVLAAAAAQGLTVAPAVP